MDPIIFAFALLLLGIGSYTDIRTREVPDWVNYGAIATGIGVSAIYSIVNATFWPLIFSLTGLLVFFGIACAMFYTGQWGGGDSKMLMGLGALVGLKFSFAKPYVDLSQLLISFWANLLLVAVVYAAFWSVFLAVKHHEKFAKQFRLQTAKVNGKAFGIAALTIMILALSITYFIQDAIIKFAATAFLLTSAIGCFLWIFAKTVEKSCMLKSVKPEKLTEGDWIAKDVIVGKKYVCGPKDLGIEKKQIKLLISLKRAGKIKKIMIKEGIPFVPAFLMSFLITIQFGNLILMAIRLS